MSKRDLIPGELVRRSDALIGPMWLYSKENIENRNISRNDRVVDEKEVSVFISHLRKKGLIGMVEVLTCTGIGFVSKWNVCPFSGE